MERLAPSSTASEDVEQPCKKWVWWRAQAAYSHCTPTDLRELWDQRKIQPTEDLLTEMWGWWLGHHSHPCNLSEDKTCNVLCLITLVLKCLVKNWYWWPYHSGFSCKTHNSNDLSFWGERRETEWCCSRVVRERAKPDGSFCTGSS